jgi:hypothetical protein
MGLDQFGPSVVEVGGGCGSRWHATAERDQVVADRMNDLITGSSRGAELRVLKPSG